jgi:hypothetical protein
MCSAAADLDKLSCLWNARSGGSGGLVVTQEMRGRTRVVLWLAFKGESVDGFL